jgi:RHS repeat-associated protein
VTAGPVGSHLISGRRLLESEALMRCLWLVLAVLVSLPSAAMAQVVEFYHLDALGSVRAVTNEQGGIVEQRDYLPFGEEWCGASGFCDPAAPGQGQPRRFTAKERDTETGLDYFGARYYRAPIARFTTIDPVLDTKASQEDSQRWNRYAHGRNNPLRYVDPDGRYDRDVHFDETYRLAVWVGLTPSEAYIIASTNQGVDDNKRTSPFPNLTQFIEEGGSGIAGTMMGLGLGVRADHHFVTPDRLAAMRAEAFETRSPSLFGVYLHAFQDTFSHQQGKTDRNGEPYGPMLGHVFTREAFKVDDPRWRPQLWKRMVEATTKELIAWRDATTRPDERDGAFTTRAPYR